MNIFGFILFWGTLKSKMYYKSNSQLYCLLQKSKISSEIKGLTPIEYRNQALAKLKYLFFNTVYLTNSVL